MINIQNTWGGRGVGGGGGGGGGVGGCFFLGGGVGGGGGLCGISKGKMDRVNILEKN